MNTAGLFAFVGGIGLFLLGMRLMTDGLKIAAGDTLRQILATATRSRWRGLLSGVLITTMVQSSSAVIFATVGFVNAGLLTLSQAIGVIYGSNLGTTLTSWIVALLGFNVNLQAVAMPGIGVGMGLWVAFGSRHWGALGQALAGLGLFFLGIDVLKESFADVGDAGALASWAGRGILSLLLFVAIGMLLTVLMQSSSAALAVTLTAAAGGLIPFAAAAAMVIGANVGTTSTAAFAAIGATAPARRAAMAHVAFNAITALAAFLSLPVLLWLVGLLGDVMGTGGQIAVLLAIFHTLTKAMGVALMWPLTPWLVRHLERRFRSTEEDESLPRHLDRNVQAAPTLALDALALELHRMNATARGLAAAALSGEGARPERFEQGHRALDQLGIAIAEFASGIERHDRDRTLSAALPHAARVAQYLANVGELALELARLQSAVELAEPVLEDEYNQLRRQAVRLLDHCDMDRPSADRDLEGLSAERDEIEHAYQALKNHLLRSGTAGVVSARRMAAALEHASALHRLLDQAVKAALYLAHFIEESRDDQVADEPDEPDETGTAVPRSQDEPAESRAAD